MPHHKKDPRHDKNHHHGNDHHGDHHHGGRPHENHPHKHGIRGDSSSALSEKDKLARLLDHWVKHNKDHADNYIQWAAKARENNLAEASRYLEEAAELTHTITEKFIQAAKSLR